MSANTPENSHLHRRTVLTAAAWTAPAIALAAAVPAASASGDPVGLACTVVPAGSFAASGPLYIDGRAGVLAGGTPPWPGAPGRTTGWTPINASDPAHIDGTWWNPSGFNPASDSGFMSQDDYNNSVDPGPNPPALTITGVFTITGATAGSTYELAMPVWGGSDFNGAQFLKIDVNGSGVNQTVLEGYRGTKSASEIPSDYDGYTTLIPDSTTYVTQFTPTSNGSVHITYTFALVYTPRGTLQNADILVGIPVVNNCVV